MAEEVCLLQGSQGSKHIAFLAQCPSTESYLPKLTPPLNTPQAPGQVFSIWACGECLPSQPKHYYPGAYLDFRSAPGSLDFDCSPPSRISR